MSRSLARFPVDARAVDALAAADGAELRAAGRITAWRRFGGIVLGRLLDSSGAIQVALRREMLADEFSKWSGSVGLGDIVGIAGQRWTTDHGEPTIDVRELVVLSKPIRSMPDKWSGITDAETRYRKRYLDLIASEDSRNRFRARAKLMSSLRRSLELEGFLEVETPILQPVVAGASARPFITHYNALDHDFFLRIAPELYLKQVVAGSFDRVYELGRNFRNEGMDPSHLQEFTMLEWYAAYWDFQDNMKFVQRVVQDAINEATGTLLIRRGGEQRDFGGTWPILDFRDEVRNSTGIDLRRLRNRTDLADAIKMSDLPLGDIDMQSMSYAGLVDALYKRTLRPELKGPVFIIRPPAEMAPLARRSDDDSSCLDLFQLVIDGWEVVKGYSELVDPIEQRVRLEEQSQLRSAGDEEAMMLDEGFLEAMEYGMPPMSGVGLGVDRLIALVTDAKSLRDVVLFPSLRPSQEFADDDR